MEEALVVIGGQDGVALPVLFAPDTKTAERVIEFFTAQIRNPNTRKAYATAAGRFATWCTDLGIGELGQIRPVHVAAYVEGLQLKIAAPSVKLQLAALRMLFNWLVVSQVIPANPAHAVRGPKHVVKKGKTPVLSAEEARVLLDSLATDSLIGLRVRALIGLMVYTFARVGAVIKMRGEDVYGVCSRNGKNRTLSFKHPHMPVPVRSTRPTVKALAPSTVTMNSGSRL